MLQVLTSCVRISQLVQQGKAKQSKKKNVLRPARLHGLHGIALSGQIVGLYVGSRSNMHVGGTPEKCALTKRDQEICEIIGPTLKKQGLLFVGIDVIGSHLTEINVTSPTGIQELTRFSGINVAKIIWETIESKL